MVFTKGEAMIDLWFYVILPNFLSFRLTQVLQWLGGIKPAVCPAIEVIAFVGMAYVLVMSRLTAKR
jgi:hypothetical protein